MATKRRRSNSWEYTIRRRGLLPKPIYLNFTSEAEGDARVAQIEAMLDRGIVPDEFQRRAAPLTIAETIRWYLDACHVSRTDAAVLPVIAGRAGKAPLSSVNYAWAESWVSSMKRERVLSPSTIRHHTGALARACDWALRAGYLPANPLRSLPRRYASYTAADEARAGRIREDAWRDRRLLPGEEERIRAILGGAKPEGRERALELRHQAHLQLLFDLALETGMRLREMFTLDGEQIDLERRTIFLDRTKNGDKRQVPISSVAFGKLGLTVRHGQVFPWLSGSSPEELERVTSLLSRQFSRVFEAAGCVDLRFHDIRHEFTCRLYERTRLTDVQIAKILGWKSLKMALRYGNLRGSDLASGMW
jgi:integrase